MPFNVDWRGLDPFRSQTEAQKKKRQYKQHEQLGEGGFGRVLRAEWRDPDEPGVKKQVALKIIDKARVNEALPVTAEIEVLQKLRHEHIVRLYDSFETKRSFYLAFELATGGELFERVRRGKFSETNAANCMQQILSGIAYLHANRIVHRDIKPENIMYRTRAPDSPIVIVDFGIAKSIDDLTDADGPEDDSDSEEEEAKRGKVRQMQVMGGEEAASNMAGTFGYASPEALKGKRPACKMDMWSIGVIAFRILAGYPPFRARSKEEMIRVTLKGRIQFHEEHWVKISNSARDFVKALLVVKPENRMSAEEALQHPWLVANATAPVTPSTSTSLAVPSAPTSSSLDSNTAVPSAPVSRRNSASPPRSLPDTPGSAVITLPDQQEVTPPSAAVGQQPASVTPNSYASSNGPLTPAHHIHGAPADTAHTGDGESEDSDDEGFYTPDEGDNDYTVPEAGTGPVRNWSRRNLRRKGQAPDAGKTLGVDTAVLPEAQAQAEAGTDGVRPTASRKSSQEPSPTESTGEKGKKGGGLGLKGMMGKLGLGAAGK